MIGCDAERRRIAPVLAQKHCNDLPSRVAYEVELRVDDPVKELIFRIREDWEGGLPSKLRVEMISLQCDVEYTETEPVFTDVLPSAVASRSISLSSGGSSDVPSFGADRSPFWCKISSFTAPPESRLKLMLIPTTLAKNSSNRRWENGELHFVQSHERKARH